jgi:hypothetical protein
MDKGEQMPLAKHRRAESQISAPIIGTDHADRSIRQVGAGMGRDTIAKVDDAARNSPTVPHDKALRGAILLQYPAQLTEILSSSLSKRLGAHAQVLDVAVNIRRYKPGRRCTFELELIPGLAEKDLKKHRRVIGKLYANNLGSKVYDTLQQLWSRGFSTGSLNVPEPLAYDPDWRLLLMSWAEGETLDELILNQLDASRAVIQAAEWLVKLHTCGGSEGRHHDFNRLHKLSLWQRYLRVVHPEAESLFAEVRSRIEEQSGVLSGWTAAPTHCDYSPDHLVINCDRITGVDFDEFGQYDPLFDVAHFMVHLRYLGLTHFGMLNQFDGLADLFQSTYKARVKDYSDARVRLYIVIVCLKMAHVIAFNRRSPNWKRLVDILLHEAWQTV